MVKKRNFLSDLQHVLIVGIFLGVQLQIPLAYGVVKEEKELKKMQDLLGERIVFSAPLEFTKGLQKEMNSCSSANCFYQAMTKYADEAKKSYKTALEQLYPSQGKSTSIRSEINKQAMSCAKSSDFLEVVGCQVSATYKTVKLLETIKEMRLKKSLNPDKAKTDYPFLKTVLAEVCGQDITSDCFDKNIDILIQQGEISLASLFDSFKNSLKVSHIGYLCAQFKDAKGAIFDCAVPASGHASWADYITGKTPQGKNVFIPYAPAIPLLSTKGSKKQAMGSEVPMPPILSVLNEGKVAFRCPNFLSSYKKFEGHTGKRGDLYRPFKEGTLANLAIQKKCMSFLDDHFAPDEHSVGGKGESRTSFKRQSQQYQELSKFLKENNLAQFREAKPNACHHWFVDIKKERALEKMVNAVDFENLTSKDPVYPMMFESLNVIQRETELDMGRFAIRRQSEMLAFSLMQSRPELIFNDQAWDQAAISLEKSNHCLLPESKRQSKLYLEQAREELKRKIPPNPDNLFNQWLIGLKTVSAEMKLVEGVLNTIKQTLAEVHCVAKVPDEAKLNLVYNYYGTVSGKFDVAPNEVYLARINALEKLAALTKKDLSSYASKEGDTNCFRLRLAKKEAQQLFEAGVSNEPLLMKRSTFKKNGIAFTGTLLELLNEPQYDRHLGYKKDFTLSVSKEVIDDGLNRMKAICAKGDEGLVEEGRRLSSTDGMVKAYLTCEDLNENKQSCDERHSTGWLLCRNYHLAFADMKDKEYWAMWKTAGLTAGVVLAMVASIPTLGGSAALAAAIGLPLGVYMTADEISEWQKERETMGAKQDDFIVQKWGNLKEFQKTAEKMEKSEFEFVSTTIAINAALMALDAVALLKYANNIRKAANVTERVGAIRTMMQAEEFKGAYQLFAKNAEDFALKPMAELKGPVINFLEKTGKEGEKQVEALRSILSSKSFYGKAVVNLPKEDVLILSLVEDRLMGLKASKGLSVTEIQRAREEIMSAITSCVVK